MTTILIVEDDPIIAAVLVDALELEGYAAIAAVDGRTAWDALALGPAAVLLDIAMPEMDGLEVLQRLRADPRTAAIPVALVSVREDVLAVARQVGVEAALHKPFDLDELLAVVARLAGPPSAPPDRA